MIRLGNISGVFGIKGWVKIHSHTQPREAISDYSPWVLSKHGKNISQRVLKLQRNGKGLIAQLDNVNDRTQAEALVGYDIYIQHDQLKQLAEQEFYWTDLEGLDVFNLENIPFGKVDYLIETGANDVLIVKSSDGKERLIPYIDDVVIKVDLDNQQLTVDWEADF